MSGPSENQPAVNYPVKELFERQEQQIDRLSERMETGFADLKREIEKLADTLTPRVAQLETLPPVVARHEDRITALEDDRKKRGWMAQGSKRVWVVFAAGVGTAGTIVGIIAPFIR